MTKTGTAPGPTADIVVGLGWGDEGKGATVDFLAHARGADRVVRFNGGQQAAHNVQVGNRHHTFSSYGSGTLAGVPTMVSRHCTIDPLAAAVEGNALADVLTDGTRFIQVHADTKVTTPLHIAVNHLRERSRGGDRHGSTGTGFGETVSWEVHGGEPLRARDLDNPDRVADWMSMYAREMGLVLHGYPLLQVAQDICKAHGQHFRNLSEDGFLGTLSQGHTVFEGAQGFMLDETFGSHPHTTWSTTTPANARELASAAGVEDVTVHGCLRTYATRHGAGPLPGEGGVVVPEPHNGTDEWAGAFRTGLWDWDLLSWSVARVRPDRISHSWLDRFPRLQCIDGEREARDLAPLSVVARGPRREDRTFA